MEENDDAGRLRLASELETHVWQCLHSPHGNHVLQKLMQLLRPQRVQFIIDETRSSSPKRVAPGSVLAARHPYGCRMMERLTEYCGSEQVDDLMHELISYAPTLCLNRYANYVLQTILEHGSCSHKKAVLCGLVENVDYWAASVKYHCLPLRIIEMVVLSDHFWERRQLCLALCNDHPNVVQTMRRKKGWVWLCNEIVANAQDFA